MDQVQDTRTYHIYSKYGTIEGDPEVRFNVEEGKRELQLRKGLLETGFSCTAELSSDGLELKATTASGAKIIMRLEPVLPS